MNLFLEIWPFLRIFVEKEMNFSLDFKLFCRIWDQKRSKQIAWFWLFSRIWDLKGVNLWLDFWPFSRSSFRKKIKELLLNFLRPEDDYVEVSRVTKLVKTLG